MRALFLCVSDHANIAARVARGINTFTGEKSARVWSLQPHPFGYEEDVTGDATVELHQWLHQGPVEWVVVSDELLLDSALLHGMLQTLRLTPQRLAGLHVGSAYRHHHDRIRTAIRGLNKFELSFVTPDLARFDTRPDRYGDEQLPEHVVPFCAPPHAVAARPVAPALNAEAPVVISHAPSSRSTKGTDEIILPVLRRIEADFPESVEILLIEGKSFDESLAQRRHAHILIDQIAPKIGGFGAAAVEACAMGQLAIADICQISSAVEAKITLPPICFVEGVLGPENAREELYCELRAILNDLPRLELSRWRALEWAQSHATPERIGRYWYTALERRIST